MSVEVEPSRVSELQPSPSSSRAAGGRHRAHNHARLQPSGQPPLATGCLPRSGEIGCATCDQPTGRRARASRRSGPREHRLLQVRASAFGPVAAAASTRDPPPRGPACLARAGDQLRVRQEKKGGDGGRSCGQREREKGPRGTRARRRPVWLPTPAECIFRLVGLPGCSAQGLFG
jgi:hypothetical protein